MATKKKNLLLVKKYMMPMLTTKEIHHIGFQNWLQKNLYMITMNSKLPRKRQDSLPVTGILIEKK